MTVAAGVAVGVRDGVRENVVVALPEADEVVVALLLPERVPVPLVVRVSERWGVRVALEALGLRV